MLRIFSPTSDQGTPHTVFLPIVIVILTVAASLLAIDYLIASIETTRRGGQSATKIVPAVTDWLEQTGRDTVIRGHIAHAFGLPDRDLPVKERGFKIAGERYTRVCALAKDGSARPGLFIALVDESDGNATIWRLAGDGALLATVKFWEGVARRIPNSEASEQFAEQVVYFRAKARSDTSAMPDRNSNAPPRPLPFQQEVTLISFSPYVLSAIIAVLLTAMFPRQRRSRDYDTS